MAWTPYTGKSAATLVSYNAVTIPGWRKITIEENGRPLPTPLDITDAGDSTYTFVDDPLGGKGDESASVTIEGFLSVADKNDGAAGLLQFAPGASHTLLITVTSGGDEYTLADAVLKTMVFNEEVAAVVPYTLTFTNSTSPGAWDTDVP